MNIRAKIRSAQTVLSDAYNSSEYRLIASSSQSESIIHIGSILFEKLALKVLADDVKETEMDIIFIGTLICALAYGQWKYQRNDKLTLVSLEPSHKYYRTPYYHLKWNELAEKCNISQITNQYDENDPAFIGLDINNPYYTGMILRAGTEILNGTISIDCELLETIFPKLNLNTIQQKISPNKGVQSAILNSGFDSDKLIFRDHYDKNVDGRAVVYKELFAETKAIWRGQRELFANTKAWYHGAGTLFANTRATLNGERPLFANTRAALNLCDTALTEKETKSNIFRR